MQKNIKVDKTAPTIEYTTTDTWSKTTAQVTLKVSDKESGVQKVVWQEGKCDNSKEWITVTGESFTTSTYTNCIKAYDNIGNIYVKYVYAKIDKEAPYTPYMSESAIQKNLNNGYIKVECPINNSDSHSNNKCILTKKYEIEKKTYWLTYPDKGPSGVEYKEYMSLTDGLSITGWKRYKVGESGDNITHNSKCDAPGKCSKRIRSVDGAGNVGPGYLEIDFVYIY